MTLQRRKFLHFTTATLAAAGWPGLSRAADYPTRPITIVAPFAAGGATDVLARVLADSMSKSLGQTIIVENVTGAAGSIGVSRVARANGDGYTLSIGTLTSHVLIGGLYKLDFDLLNDLTPIAELAYEPLMICVKNALPVRNLEELIAWLKANPDAPVQPARCADDRRSGAARILCFDLVWVVGAEKHAEGRNRQAQRRGCHRLGRR
jgi:tripartite-type tricarboxylate transporter receptor subunit TctC